MSLLGDTITVVTQQSRTGSRISQNVREPVVIPGGVFDKSVLRTMDKIVKAEGPTADVSVLNINAVGALGDAEKFVVDGELHLPAALANGLKHVDCSHFLLVLPHRAEANIKGMRESVGSGMLQGLGFYLDRELRILNYETGASRTGYLAPYAYVNLILVDKATGKILRQQSVAEAIMLGDVARKAGVGDPWEMLSTQEKVDAISSLLDDQLAKRIPQLLAQ